MTNVTHHHGPALNVLPTLTAASAQTIVTSPPYWGLRDYGTTGEPYPAVTYAPIVGLPPVTVEAMTVPLGQEPTPEAYIGHMVAICRGP